MCERNDERTKASFRSGKVHDKDKGVIVQSAQHNRIHSLNRTDLINERSVTNKEEHRGINVIVKI